MDVAGLWAAGCGLLLLAGLGMMIVNIAFGHAGYLWPSGLLGAAFAYAAAHMAVFIGTLLADSFAIFADVYLIAVVLVAPAMMLVALVIVVGFVKRLGWLGTLGFCVWVEGIALAHLWIIAAAAQSV